MSIDARPNPPIGLVIFVKDKARMLAFYQRTLGLKWIEEDASCAFS